VFDLCREPASTPEHREVSEDVWRLVHVAD
jgi:hypothetical protein